jgi:hypothetical protein
MGPRLNAVAITSQRTLRQSSVVAAAFAGRSQIGSCSWRNAVPTRRAEAIRQVVLDDCACNAGLSDSVAVSLSAEPLEIDASTFQDQQGM